ncbi:TKL/DRK protein kinase [Aphanomyces invadans]|uniref:TKL/DRK protein kinase n=1 Tax=Aphanomyces invadans TaxID=157072 RepID=A0A024UAA2_9STRA|nr:TKL/DRK protein kinase [Aphanomyces invadans]ETW03145.1 TKL/DRK protein kinase [Aphanomyces invadans]|eukprot:XP_008868529.1 TKL/DRK protein kinase [Aphanomyces invadans]
MGFFSGWRKEKEDVNTLSLVRMERLYDEMQKRKNGDMSSADRTASYMNSNSRGGRSTAIAPPPPTDLQATSGTNAVPDVVATTPSPQDLSAHTRELDATLFYRASCRFLDPTLEQLYQEYCQVEWYVRARNTVMVMMMLHIVFFIVTSMKSSSAEDLLPKDFNRAEEWVQWAYFFAAVPFVAWVDEDSPFRRRWKVAVTLTLLTFICGTQMWLGYQGSASTTEFLKLLASQPTASSNASTCNRTAYSELNLEQTNKNLLSAFVALAAIFLILIGSTLAVVIRLDFPQVVFLLLTTSTSLGMVLHLYSLSVQAVILVSYATPGFLLCMACYHSDRSARRSFLAKIHVEKENADLQFTLNRAEKALMNDSACDAETHAVRQVLKSKHLEMIQIPFADLKFEKIIGRGASGEVIKASYLGTAVVCKRMRRDAITLPSIQRFREEIELMSCLRHPNIVQFIGASWDNCSNVCMVLEYMEHGDMHSVLHSAIGRSFVWSDPLLKMAVGAVSGMLYLHSQEPPVVHRDLKSVNLLCSATFGCKVSDFGLSRRYKKDLDALTTVVGTPFWLAPEVIRNEKYGISADIYSFGIVLTELETRQTPYHDIDQTGLKVMLRVAKDGLRPSLPPTCLPRRRQLIQDCLLDHPGSRPTFLEVLHRLQGEVREEIEADAEKLAIDRRALLRTKAMKREQSVRRLDQL